MKRTQRAICLTIALITAVPTWAQTKDTKDAKKKETEEAQPLKSYYGPLRRAAVTAMEVKVQGVTTTAPTPSGTTTVVTLDIQQPTEFGTGLSDMLTTALVESKRFVVMERLNLEEVNKEKALGQNPDVNPATIVKPGQLAGAQVIIRGAVTEFAVKRSGSGADLQSSVLQFGRSSATATIAIDLKIVDVATAQVLDSVRAEGKAESKAQSVTLTVAKVKIGENSFDNSPLGLAVRRAISDGVHKLCERAEKIPWEAKVAAVAEADGKPQLYLNMGKDSGLEPGDILEIKRPGADIIDPDTKLVIGKIKGKMLGRCRVTEVQPRLTVVVPIEGSGFEREDVVTFVERPTKRNADPRGA